MSETAAALVRDWLPPGAALADLGSHRLKDLGRPERNFQLHAWREAESPFPPSRARWATRRCRTTCPPSWRRLSAASGKWPRSGR